MKALRLLSQTKLYWGLLIICLIGALTSPHTSSGKNIFLSYGNLLDVLRQVSITGLVATGMTLVILTAGIDLSVGSVMAMCTVVCGMLLTMPGWTPAAVIGVPAATLVAFVGVAALTRFIVKGLAAKGDGAAAIGHRETAVLTPFRGRVLPLLV